MTVFRTAFALWLGIMTPAWGHEFWIEPSDYTLNPNANVDANLLVGSDFVGPDYIFIPDGYFLARFVAPNGERDIVFTGQEKPSLSLKTTESGLHAIVLVSKSSKLEHDDFAAFSAFAETVGRSADISAARQDGPVREAYFRYAKTLVSVGEGAGQDNAYGAIYEWVAIDNPYTTADGPLRFQLLFDGKPAADQPVQLFARDLGNKGEVQPMHLSTNGEGVLLLPEKVRGEIMLNSVKLLAVQSENLDWVSHWASITFARVAPAR